MVVVLVYGCLPIRERRGRARVVPMTLGAQNLCVLFLGAKMGANIASGLMSVAEIVYGTMPILIAGRAGWEPSQSYALDSQDVPASSGTGLSGTDRSRGEFYLTARCDWLSDVSCHGSVWFRWLPITRVLVTVENMAHSL